MAKYKRDVTERILEKSVGELCRGLFRLMEDGHHKDAYSTMGIILNMLLEDREMLRNKYPELSSQGI
jgi:hypothetical protein